MVYLYVFLFFCFSFILIDNNNSSELRKSKIETIYAFSLFSMIILAFLVGVNTDKADYESYLSIFENSIPIFSDGYMEYSSKQHTEFGYNLFQSIIKEISNSSTLWFTLFCFVSLVFRYKFYRKFVPLSDIGIVIFSFLAHEFLRKDCVQIRNGFASALVLFSLICLFNGKRMKFIIIVICASLFHKVSLITLPLVIVRKTRSRLYEKVLFHVFLMSIIISICLPIRNILTILAEVGLLPNQVITYLNWSTYLVSMKFSNPLLLKQIVIVFFIFFNKKKYFYNNTIFFLFQVYLVSTVYYLIFRDFEILAARFGSLFYGVEGAMLCNMINNSKAKILQKKILMLSCYFALLIYNYLTFQEFLGWNPVIR